MYETSHIGTCNFPSPRLNFGPRWTASNAEEDFARSFAVDYDSRYAAIHPGSSKMCRVLAHEVPVNGFGIADLVTVSWNTGAANPLNLPAAWNELHAQPTVRAFEVKLSDWRRGLMQAHRYNYFADTAILVLPTAKLPTVLNLDTFKNIRVGLWGYDETTGKIIKIYTPRPKRPVRPNHREKAIERVLAVINQAPSSS
ncbi:MAG: hypothetical protein KKB30_04615 [Proteobacteria bacterium]|nr:hypothetical protein [Pseudomonadota bacterium]MBU1715508.1 hypothetical protein [Pseudomonadota bacterium]